MLKVKVRYGYQWKWSHEKYLPLFYGQMLTFEFIEIFPSYSKQNANIFLYYQKATGTTDYKLVNLVFSEYLPKTILFPTVSALLVEHPVVFESCKGLVIWRAHEKKTQPKVNNLNDIWNK